MTDTPASHLDDAVAEMALVTRDNVATTQAFENAVRGVWEAAARATPAAASAALTVLLPLLAIPSPVRAGFAGLCCGGLVERGADPNIALEPVVHRLRGVLPEAEAFAAAALELAASDIPAGADPATVIDEYGNYVAQQRPQLVWAWTAIDLFGRAAIAMLSRSKAGRQAIHGDAAFVAGLARLALCQPLADWLSQLLAIQDDEDLLIIHPAVGRGPSRGYRVRISGIADNFQLHTLLAGALLGDPAQGWLPGPQPNPAVLAAARGEPISTENLTAQGVFNLFSWRSLSAAGKLPIGTTDTTHWIWGEGSPRDIEPFEGLRILLLSDSTDVRSWSAEPRFPGLLAELQVQEKLAPSSVAAWLRRLSKAAQASAQ